MHSATTEAAGLKGCLNKNFEEDDKTFPVAAALILRLGQRDSTTPAGASSHGLAERFDSQSRNYKINTIHLSSLRKNIDSAVFFTDEKHYKLFSFSNLKVYRFC